MLSFFARQRHPHGYTLDLMKLAIDRLPPTFSEERKSHYADLHARFSRDRQVEYDAIRAAIAMLGKESWAYRKAYEEMYVRFGRASEESFLLQHLDQGIREKYARFLQEGGKLNYIETAKSAADMHQPSPFERYFTPEEKFAIDQALFVSREEARREIDSLVTDKKDVEYAKLVEAYRVKQRAIEEKLEELRGLASVSSKWEAEIVDRVRTIEEGWSVVERGMDVGQLEKETEYWKGTLEAFLHA
jgi:hypothetical protein